MIIKKKVRVVKEEEIEENILVNKKNACSILKKIDKNNPYYKFVKALSQGKNVLLDGRKQENYYFSCDPCRYSIEDSFIRSEWTLVLVQNESKNYILHKTTAQYLLTMDESSRPKFFSIFDTNHLSTDEVEQLPIFK